MDSGIFYKIRRWIVVISGNFFVGGFYGMILAILARHFFDISENNALIFVALPAAIVVACFMGRKMAKIFGFDD